MSRSLKSMETIIFKGVRIKLKTTVCNYLYATWVDQLVLFTALMLWSDYLTLFA